jgi:hypothetical protein
VLRGLRNWRDPGAGLSRALGHVRQCVRYELLPRRRGRESSGVGFHAGRASLRFFRLLTLAALALPTLLSAQGNAVGNWKAVFVGPLGPRPKMVSAVTFSILATSNGLAGTARTEPEWPGDLTVSDVKLDGDQLSFTGTGKEGWSVNGVYHCCPRLVFVGTVKGDEMKLTMTWTSTEQPNDPSAQPVPMEAKRISK